MSYRESLNYFHIPGAIAATVVKANPGVLHSVVINTVGATPGALVISDGTLAASNVIASILPVTNTTVTPLICLYDVRFNVGLVVSGSGSTMDVTISYE